MESAATPCSASSSRAAARIASILAWLLARGLREATARLISC
jgi:hypothetical protein